MTNELFIEFLKHLARYKTPGKCLLILDGAACHLEVGRSASIVEVADSLDIALYCLPSNTTHELQPLDKTVYRSFEHQWDSELLLFMEQNPDKKLTKARFNIILTTVWSKSISHSNIISGFSATDLYPFNPSAFPETAFTPSVLSKAPAPVPDAVAVENSPPRAPSRQMAPETPQPSTSRQEQTIDHTPKRSYNMFYRMVYGSSSSDNEDNIPLAQVKRTSFKQLLPTPAKNTEKTPTVRRKAINYKGTPITKNLFNKNKIEKDIKNYKDQRS